MKSTLLPALFFALTLSCDAQTSTGSNSPAVSELSGHASIQYGSGSLPTAKPSPASDALNKAAQESTVQQQTFDAAFQTAKAALDAQVKDLQKQSAELNQQLNAQIRADKHYKPLFEKIDAIQKQLAALNKDATDKFQQNVGPIQNQLATNKVLIESLVPIVRKENGWPESATFDAATQTWKGITAEDKK